MAANKTVHPRRDAAGGLERVGGSDLRDEPAEVYGVPGPKGTDGTATPRPASGTLRRAALLLAAALLVLVLACWAVVAVLGAFPGDREVAADVAEERLGWWGLLPARILDWLGEPLPAAATVVAIAVGAAIGLGWRAAVLVVAAAGASAVTYALKLLFDRERPTTDLELDPSFPSGHTAFATAVFGLAALMALARGRWLAALGAVAVVAAMGPSRLLLGVHWTSDVLAGYAVGLAWLALVLALGSGWAWRAARRRARAPTAPGTWPSPGRARGTTRRRP